jgi:hypothetical protein
VAKANKIIKEAARIKRLKVKKGSSTKEIEFAKAIKPSLNASSIAKNTLNRSQRTKLNTFAQVLIPSKLAILSRISNTI